MQLSAGARHQEPHPQLQQGASGALLAAPTHLEDQGSRCLLSLSRPCAAQACTCLKALGLRIHLKALSNQWKYPHWLHVALMGNSTLKSHWAKTTAPAGLLGGVCSFSAKLTRRMHSLLATSMGSSRFSDGLLKSPSYIIFPLFLAPYGAPKSKSSWGHGKLRLSQEQAW